MGGYYFNLSFNFRPADELYRLSDDPAGVRNLANDPAFAGVMAELKDRMLDLLKQEGDPRALGNGAVFDTYDYTKPSPKDYATWLATQDELLSAEAERRAQETKGQQKRARKQPAP